MTTDLEKRLDVMRFLRGIFNEEARQKTKEAGEAIRRAAEVELACAKLEEEKMKNGEKQ